MKQRVFFESGAFLITARGSCVRGGGGGMKREIESRRTASGDIFLRVTELLITSRGVGSEQEKGCEIRD